MASSASPLFVLGAARVAPPSLIFQANTEWLGRVPCANPHSPAAAREIPKLPLIQVQR